MGRFMSQDALPIIWLQLPKLVDGKLEQPWRDGPDGKHAQGDAAHQVGHEKALRKMCGCDLGSCVHSASIPSRQAA